jgi:hypothetical protein
MPRALRRPSAASWRSRRPEPLDRRHGLTVSAPRLARRRARFSLPRDCRQPGFEIRDVRTAGCWFGVPRQ